MQKEEKGSFQHPTPNKHPNAHIKVTNTHTHERAGHRMASLENWDSGLANCTEPNKPYLRFSIIHEVFQIHESGIRVWFEEVQQEMRFQLFTLLTLHSLGKYSGCHFLISVQSPLGILQYYLNITTPIYMKKRAASGGTGTHDILRSSN